MKKKLNVIIGKKQIIVASLVLILGVAVYLNWQFAGSDQALTVADIFGTGNQTSSNANYGQAELVSENSISDYFTQARLSKQKTRDEQTDSLTTMLNSTSLSDTDKATISAQAVAMSNYAQAETNIENQVKAKGFEDCVAYVDGDRVNVTVKASDMTAEQAAQIRDIILGETSVDVSNIVVTPVG